MSSGKRIEALDRKLGALAAQIEATDTNTMVRKARDKMLGTISDAEADRITDALSVEVRREADGVPAGARNLILRQASEDLDGVMREGRDALRILVAPILAQASPTDDDYEALRSGARRVSSMATTIADTAVIAAARARTISEGDTAGLVLFEYLGPVDGLTRPFCAEHAGKAFSVEALDALDNGQIAPVSLYLGGYNCRHQLGPIDEDMARARGIEVIE